METSNTDNQTTKNNPVINNQQTQKIYPKINKSFLLIVCLLFLLIAAFILGYKISAIKSPKIQFVDKEKVVKVYPTESPGDLLTRCGDPPMSIYKNTGHYDIVDGPTWSPDCRHIAWSLWESGTSYLGDDPAILKEIENNPRKLSGKEGVFVLTDSNQSVQKIYNPKELNESPVFVRWENKDTIIFKVKNIEYSHSLLTKEQRLVEK